MITIPILMMYVLLFVGLYFQIFLLATFLEEKKRDRKSLPRPSSFPEVTIIVPCWNEEKTLEGTIRSLMALNYPKKKLRVVVIDDGSTDNTRSVAEELKKEFPSVFVYSQNNGGKHTAVNFGIENTKSPFVGCLDADSFVDPQALQRIIPLFKDPKVMSVTPAIRVHEPKNILQLIQRAEYNFGIWSKYLFGKLGALYVAPGPFSIFRRKIFDELGGFRNAHNTEDMEIAFRMQANHHKIVNCPDAYVYTVAPNTFKKLYRQRVRWMYGFLRNCFDYRFLFFKKKYGNLGIFMLPFSFFSIFAALYLTATSLTNAVQYLDAKIIKIETVGLNIKLPTFDWFFVDTKAAGFIMLALMGLTFLMLLLGRKMAEDTYKPRLDMLYFMFLYSFMAPIWLTKAVYNTILSKKSPWR